MNQITFTIFNADNSTRDFTLTSKEWKNELIPDNGMPFDLSITITDEKGGEVSIDFDSKGACAIRK